MAARWFCIAYDNSMRTHHSKVLPPFLVKYLVSRMAVSWCCGWSSPFMLMFFCHLQKFFRVSSAWCVIFKSFCVGGERWLRTHTELWGLSPVCSHTMTGVRDSRDRLTRPPSLHPSGYNWTKTVSRTRSVRGHCLGLGGLCLSFLGHSKHRIVELPFGDSLRLYDLSPPHLPV